MLKTVLCMPVGPSGIKAETCQFVTSLVCSGRVQSLLLATGHLIRARNTCYAAIPSGVDRVIWLDSDIYADLAAFERFIDRGEQAFSADSSLGWYGAVCVKRGAKNLVNFSMDRSHWRGGLGLVYWHAPRVTSVLAPDPFRWIEPLSEDYRLCDDLFDRGVSIKIDCRLPTVHIDAGRWPGDSEPEHIADIESEMRAEETQMRLFADVPALPAASGAV